MLSIGPAEFSYKVRKPRHELCRPIVLNFIVVAHLIPSLAIRDG